MATRLTRRKFTAEEYHWMVRVGILREDDRLELIEGEIVEMPPIGPEHASTTDATNEIFVHRFSDVARVRVQNPIRLDGSNEPEPDIALVRRRADAYRTALPGPDDIFLLVEISDTALATDRDVKVPLYARAGIPEVWLIDLPHRLLHIYRAPSRDGYREVSTARPGEAVAPSAFPDRPVAVSDLIA